jgi:hypothetical protein
MSLLKRRSHRQQRERREGVRDGVDHERQSTCHREECAAERRPRKANGGLASGLRGRGGRELTRRHDGTKGAHLCGTEDGGSGTLDERDEHDQPERRSAGDDRRRKNGERDDSHAVGADHQPLAIPAVGCHTCRQREERRGKRAREPDDTRPCGRTGQGEDEQRIRNGAELRARTREQLSDLEEKEVAVSA